MVKDTRWSPALVGVGRCSTWRLGGNNDNDNKNINILHKPLNGFIFLAISLSFLFSSSSLSSHQVWIFGDIWCRIWLAVDVWMCTASILNLCAISLDRYVAVTRPVTYPSIMSTTKAKSLIAGIWVLSFVICFPPLVGWKDKMVSFLTARPVIDDPTTLGVISCHRRLSVPLHSQIYHRRLRRTR